MSSMRSQSRRQSKCTQFVVTKKNKTNQVHFFFSSVLSDGDIGLVMKLDEDAKRGFCLFATDFLFYFSNSSYLQKRTSNTKMKLPKLPPHDNKNKSNIHRIHVDK